MGLGKYERKKVGSRVEIDSLRLFYKRMAKGDAEEHEIIKKPGGIKAANARPGGFSETQFRAELGNDERIYQKS